MELDAIKKSWAALDKRMQKTADFNTKVLDRIISQRALTTVDKIKRLNLFFYTVLLIELTVFVAILIGNPFDFQYTVQYIPYGLLFIAVLIAFINLFTLDKVIRRLAPDIRIDQYIMQIVSAYDRNKRFEKWFGIIFLLIGLLVPFSFLPNKMTTVGVWQAIGDTAIMILVSLTIYALAFKLGAFRNPHKRKLQQDLKDWNELRQLVREFPESDDMDESVPRRME
jgi:hypothetical protein